MGGMSCEANQNRACDEYFAAMHLLGGGSDWCEICPPSNWFAMI
jgi:hypothetical protein